MEKDNRQFLWGMLAGFGSALALAAVAIVLCAVLLIGLFNRANGGDKEAAETTPSAGQEENAGAAESSARADADGKLEYIRSLIDQNYIFDYDEDYMTDEMLAAYVGGLGDVYSQYFTVDEINDMMNDMNGEYYGIGVLASQRDDGVYINQVYTQGPSFNSGLLAEDRIVGVDGTDVREMSLDEIVALIRGEEGTPVDITVVHAAEPGEHTYTIVRGVVYVDTVSYEMLPDDIGYISLEEFDSVAIDQMKEAISDLVKQGAKGMIVDIRDNPGGWLESVLEITDYFLPKDQMIFFTENKAGEQTEYYAEKKPLFDGPLVVMINGNSASASEVFSGCLKDNDRATLVGTQSFGKGIVQTFFFMDDGTAVKLTTEHYCTPSGQDIHGIGITPDIVVEYSEDGADPQLDAAIDELERLIALDDAA